MVRFTLRLMLQHVCEQGKKMTGQVLQRAASGLVQFCTYHRPKVGTAFAAHLIFILLSVVFGLTVFRRVGQ